MYKKMIEEAKAKGLTTEKMMWQSVDDVEEMLCTIKQEHPDTTIIFVTHRLDAVQYATDQITIHKN